ncbi:glycosyltransferase family 2 protein [Sphingobium subterraneum]|uniref:Glycosyltransferase involved in cell wall biosynthesis n=1 Tax=Sphingobium subterraneum TaxID=627688 RepID=A0A841J6W4_9SPHN|nr:glycosyltransferase family 2 protein [Sphingobium subterraneum]MBB6125266.1 glycosyltransferase involved in cell wall biosynthesis [Sphingobium subterraneum]
MKSPTYPVVLTIIVPVKNEADGIEHFLNRIVPVLENIPKKPAWEIIFVDDGSTDGTLAEILSSRSKDSRICAVELSRNFGKEAALSAGLDHARGAAVIPIDVDLQDPPEVIVAMVEKWRAGFEVVCGVRTNRQTDGFVKRSTANLYYRIHNWLSDHKIIEHAGDFRLMDRRVVEVVRRLPERNRFMKALFSWSGFRETTVEYQRNEREAGTTKFNYFKLWRLALDGITATTTVPLRIWSYLGFVLAAVGLVFAGWLVLDTILRGNSVPGYSSLMVAVLVFGGIQLLSLGILGEYVGRILIEVKQRPVYIVRDSFGLEERE